MKEIDQKGTRRNMQQEYLVIFGSTIQIQRDINKGGQKRFY